MTVIYVICSQASDQQSYTVHGWSPYIEEIQSELQRVAMVALKNHRGMNENEHLECPLSDTIPLEKISDGVSTIRYVDKEQRTINLYQIIKERTITSGYLIPEKRQVVIKTFRIVEVPSVGNVPEFKIHEDDDDDEESFDSE